MVGMNRFRLDDRGWWVANYSDRHSARWTKPERRALKKRYRALLNYRWRKGYGHRHKDIIWTLALEHGRSYCAIDTQLRLLGIRERKYARVR